jgi:hypothetical protein
MDAAAANTQYRVIFPLISKAVHHYVGQKMRLVRILSLYFSLSLSPPLRFFKQTDGQIWPATDGDRQTETDRQTDGDRQTEGERQTDGDRRRETDRQTCGTSDNVDGQSDGRMEMEVTSQSDRLRHRQLILRRRCVYQVTRYHIPQDCK